MKDKENQIEEMISAMAASNNPFVDVPIEIMPKVAEALYNAGYRKLPEDSVVLSKEEYKRITKELVTEQRATEIAKEYFEKIRNETAEKILNDLVKNCQYTFNIDGKPIVELDSDFVLNAAKSYGIEIKE